MINTMAWVGVGGGLVGIAAALEEGKNLIKNGVKGLKTFLGYYFWVIGIIAE